MRIVPTPSRAIPINFVKPTKRKRRHPQAAKEQTCHRKVCYHCFRPRPFCFCHAIPDIDNSTDVLILQHQKERSHPFNTARMVHRALRRSTLICGRNEELGRSIPLPLSRNAALLYPGTKNRLISDLCQEERPDQLVILDGTWHQAKTLLRDIPALGDLPQYQLVPARPGQYRIRLEPTETSLSTVEAVVSALQAIEPETPGLERLYEAFNVMVESQLAHPNAVYTGRRSDTGKRPKPGIPYAVICDLENIVIAYGESIGRERENSMKRMPIFWVAQRMVSHEFFQAAIRHGDLIPTLSTLNQLQLGQSHFENAITVEEFLRSWQSFMRPHDVLAVYHHGTIKMLENIDFPVGQNLVLKSVDLGCESIDKSLENVLRANGLAIHSNGIPGRAGQRLAGLCAFVQHLHHIGQIHMAAPRDLPLTTKKT